MPSLLVLVTMITLHDPNGWEISVNPRQITTLRESHDEASKDRVMGKSVRCVVGLSDGKFAGVVEPCTEIKRMIDPK